MLRRMDFLFKHINGNRFILSENQKDENHITKQEEYEALQVIRIKLIPEAVQKWNIRHSPPYSNITEDDVRKHLIKKTNNSYDHTTDSKYTTYQFHVIKNGYPVLINFFIHKSNEELFVAYQDMLGNSNKQIPVRKNKIAENKSKINEVDRSVSKMEEDQTLQDIRNNIIPEIIRLWNKKRRHYSEFRNIDVTVQDISRNLRKVDQARHNPNDSTTSDVTFYKSEIPALKSSFEFRAYKQVHNGKMVVWVTFPDKDSIHLDPKTILLREETDKRDTISKLEEQQALDFIKRKVIPMALFSYNQYSENWNFQPVTDEEIRKNLKKTLEDFTDRIGKDHQMTMAIQAAYDPKVVYEADVNNRRWVFTILRSGKDDHLYVTWTNPYTFSGKWTLVSFNINEGIEESRPGTISKMEEQYALQAIKKYMVPRAVKDANKYLTSNRGRIKFSISQLLDERDIILHLKKSDHRSNHLGVDRIEYTSKNPGRINVEFFITMSSNGYEYKLYIGYHSLFKETPGFSMVIPST